MDFSAIAAVGSFVMSERVLKPKATVLFVLGCLLAYDLTTKTHDISSLRVYRGPALLAFTLMMSAYSLRTWRRNGVACDELIFLPGTLHGHEHGVEGPLIEMPEKTNLHQQPLTPSQHSIGSRNSISDMLGIPGPPLEASETNNSSSLSPGRGSPNNSTRQQQIKKQHSELVPLAREADMAAGGFNSQNHRTNQFRKRRVQSDDETLLYSNSDEGKEDGNANNNHDNNNQTIDESLRSQQSHELDRSNNSHSSWEPELEMDGEDNVQTQTLLHHGGGGGGGEHNNNNDDDEACNHSEASNPHAMEAASGPVQRWRENHPRLARLGTFFFFRSTTATSSTNAVYAPSGPAVFGAGLDMSMPVMFNFHLFIEAFNHQGEDESDTPIKILPLIFLSVLIVRTVIPPGRRFRFWGTMKFTFAAPLYKVRFRDEFIGDALTSWVRPGQDLFFALSYYVTVIAGSVSGIHNLTESGMLLEESWTLHNVLMPSFAILPLWLKYLQTLRQAYDTNKRWPYQGNSIKYLSATLVVIYACTHPERRKSGWFILCFILALLYQLYWDVFIDWELFEIQRDIQLVDAEEPDNFCSRISSFRPSSTFLLRVQMYLVQPICDQYQKLRAMMPSWGEIRLREKRLYKTENFYWKILAYNTLMRFTWMLCFIPAYHVARDRTVLTSTNDVNSYWGVILPVAEIVRRTLWGFLFVERETIKLMESDAKYSRVASAEDPSESNRDDDEDEDEDADSKLGLRSFRTQLLPTWLDAQQQTAVNAATSMNKERDMFRRQLFVIELYVWAAAFVGLGCWAASS